MHLQFLFNEHLTDFNTGAIVGIVVGVLFLLATASTALFFFIWFCRRKSQPIAMASLCVCAVCLCMCTYIHHCVCVCVCVQCTHVYSNAKHAQVKCEPAINYMLSFFVLFRVKKK